MRVKNLTLKYPPQSRIEGLEPIDLSKMCSLRVLKFEAKDYIKLHALKLNNLQRIAVKLVIRHQEEYILTELDPQRVRKIGIECYTILPNELTLALSKFQTIEFIQMYERSAFF